MHRRDALLFRVFLRNEIADFLQIRVAEQQQAVGVFAVAPGASDLLIIAFDVLRQIVMQNKANVRLIDAHAEGDGRHHDLRVVADERLLIALPRRVLHSGVIRLHGKMLPRERVGHVLDLLARRAIDDAGLIRKLRQKVHRLPHRLRLLPDLQKKIFPVETGEKRVRIGETQALLDVLLDARRRGGGQGHADGLRKARPAFDKLPVFGAEIMPPFRNAMRFVNHQCIHALRRQQRERSRHQQRFWRKVEQFDFVPRDAGDVLAVRFRRKRAIQRDRRNAKRGQLLDLIFHQGNERRHHDGQAVKNQRRNLVAERLSAAGRHNHQRIFPRQDVFDDFLLQRAKCVIAENGFEQRFGLMNHNTLRRCKVMGRIVGQLEDV